MKIRLIVPLLLAAVLAGCSITPADEYYGSADTDGDIKVTVFISCATVLDNLDALSEELADFVPEGGIILEKTETALDADATAFDALRAAARENGVQYEYEGSGADVYVEGIGYIYETSCGALSGWEYSINGEFPSVGCNAYTLSDGDEVEFLYTCDLGVDIGNAYMGD